MQHPAELSVHAFLRKALRGEVTLSEENVQQVSSDVTTALNKQFNGEGERKFRIRMSNIGRPKCQLWFEKNNPETDIEKPTSFMINMLMGDLIEAVFKGILREAGVTFTDNQKVSLPMPDGKEISGEYDMVLDGKVDDIKSTSPYGWDNKFSSYQALQKDDAFGYISQLVGYAEAAGKDVGGWWVVNKANGSFKYLPSESDKETVLTSIQDTYQYLEEDKPFERCYEPEPEVYRRKPSGNMKLCKTCGWCAHKKKCWPTLQTLPSRVYSGSKTPPMVDYVELADDTPTSEG